MHSAAGYPLVIYKYDEFTCLHFQDTLIQLLKALSKESQSFHCKLYKQNASWLEYHEVGSTMACLNQNP